MPSDKTHTHTQKTARALLHRNTYTHGRSRCADSLSSRQPRPFSCVSWEHQHTHKHTRAHTHTHRAGLILSTQHGFLMVHLSSSAALKRFLCFSESKVHAALPVLEASQADLLLSFHKRKAHLLDFLASQIRSYHCHWQQTGGPRDDFGYKAIWDMSVSAEEGGPITVASREHRPQYDLVSYYRAQWQGLYLPVSVGASGLQ